MLPKITLIAGFGSKLQETKALHFDKQKRVSMAGDRAKQMLGPFQPVILLVLSQTIAVFNARHCGTLRPPHYQSAV
jgi:hypothetical protein